MKKIMTKNYQIQNIASNIQNQRPVELHKYTYAGTGSTVKEERKDYTDKSDPIREHDCIWCIARVSVCPTREIKVDQSNLQTVLTPYQCIRFRLIWLY
jgi:hypothetical protein